MNNTYEILLNERVVATIKWHGPKALYECRDINGKLVTTSLGIDVCEDVFCKQQQYSKLEISWIRVRAVN